MLRREFLCPINPKQLCGFGWFDFLIQPKQGNFVWFWLDNECYLRGQAWSQLFFHPQRRCHFE